jgi:hypothetical protein
MRQTKEVDELGSASQSLSKAGSSRDLGGFQMYDSDVEYSSMGQKWQICLRPSE